MRADFEVNFSAVKFRHTCNDFGYAPVTPPDGECPPFDSLAFGQPYEGVFKLSLDVVKEDDGSLSSPFPQVNPFNISCTIAQERCAFGVISQIDAFASYNQLSGRSASTSTLWRFTFDADGSGYLYYADDNFPVDATVEFIVTNARISGLPPAPVPLPAGTVLFGSALILLAAQRRRRARG